MKHLSTDFTFDGATFPRCNIWEAKDIGTFYVQFDGGDGYPRASFFLHNEQGLINFKNEINWAFETFMRGRNDSD